ncbi:MAG TPA: PAS domain-containing protein [Opitutaceae bacterium]
MRLLRDISIGRKLIAIAMLSSLSALLLACAAIVTYNHLAFRAAMKRDLSITARMIGINSAAAITFDDPESAEQDLKSLGAHPHVVSACLYTADGKVFAVYRRDGDIAGSRPPPAGRGERFVPGALQVFREITAGGERVGTVFLESDLGELDARLARNAGTMGVVTLAAGLLAFIVASRLKRVISDPVRQLAQMAATVAAGRNYAVRGIKQSDDELGRLVDGFNHMLAQIEARDAELRAAQDHLERRVAERTGELQCEVAERERAEAALRESQQMYHSLVEHLPICVYRKDKDGRFVFTNERFCRFVGVAADTVLGRTMHQLVSPEVAERIEKEDRAILAGERFVEVEDIHQKPDGDIVHLHRLKVPVLDAAARIIGMQGMFFDITERKHAEAEREQLHRQLLETSRLAGMAEVATGVLHNVGNVLNSVNVSATLVADRVRRSRAGSIASLATLLRGQAHDLPAFFARDPRGREVPAFLEALAAHLTTERAGIVEELEQLRRNIDHIKEVVAMQQGYAKISGVTECVPLVDLVEDALRLNGGALARHGVAIVREYDARPAVAVEKHKLLQILVNVIGNAKYACDESGRRDKRIVMRIGAAEGRVRISVSDNGAGIDPGNLTRIFSHGFTTRKDGHGFGLHSGALAARELGGTLTAQSDGPGLGATFTLDLPLPAGVPAAA